MSTASTDLSRASQPPRELSYVLSTEQRLRRTMDRLDIYAVVLWAFASVWAPYEPLTLVTTALRYGLALYFTLAFFMRANTFLPLLAKCWPMLIIGVLSIISVLWAPSATGAIRKAMLVAMTAFVAIHIAARTPGRQIVLIYMLVSLPSGVLNLIEPNVIGGAANGFYGQKNFLAIHMFILAMTGLVVLLDKTYSFVPRLLAVPAILIGSYLIFLSLSATTMVLFILGAFALVFHQYVWRPASRLQHMRVMLVLLIAILGLLVVFITVALLQTDVESAFLEMLGKNKTLTGRTIIWDRAERILEQHPWTGLGPGGFWQPNNGDARQVLSDLGLHTWVTISFHNAYYEYGSQFGYPGVVAAIVIIGWTTIYSAICWLRAQTLQNAFFLLFCLLQVVRSQAEADLCAEISNMLVLFYIGGARGVIAASRRRGEPAVT